MNIEKIREALEVAEAMADVFDQLSQKLGDLRERNTDRTRLEEIREALAELDKVQQPGNVLTDDHYRIIADRMIEEHRKYGDKLRLGHWADVAARKVASHLADFGYLAPAAGLTVEEAHEIALQWVSEEDLEHGYTEQAAARLRARLTSAQEAKSAKQ